MGCSGGVELDHLLSLLFEREFSACRACCEDELDRVVGEVVGEVLALDETFVSLKAFGMSTELVVLGRFLGLVVGR